MKLIEFDGVDFKLSDNAFYVPQIREMFQKDKSKKKEEFWRNLSYMWFMCDPFSSYMYLTDEKEREAEVRKLEGFPEDWKPDKTLKDAMRVYHSLTITTESLLLESMRKGIDAVRAFLETAKLTKLDDKGKPLYQVSSFTSALRQIPELAKALADAEKALAQNYIEADKARGTAQKAVGEDI